MATLLDRIFKSNDWATDGGWINYLDLDMWLHLYESGTVTAADCRTALNIQTNQLTDFNSLLGTLPTALLTVLNATSRARWASHITYVLQGYGYSVPGISTYPGIKTELGF